MLCGSRSSYRGGRAGPGGGVGQKFVTGVTTNSVTAVTPAQYGFTTSYMSVNYKCCVSVNQLGWENR